MLKIIWCAPVPFGVSVCILDTRAVTCDECGASSLAWSGWGSEPPVIRYARIKALGVEIKACLVLAGRNATERMLYAYRIHQLEW